jgi:hypothetical protein
MKYIALGLCVVAADNEDIDLLGNRTLRTRGRIALRPIEDLRVARLETIQDTALASL